MLWTEIMVKYKFWAFCHQVTNSVGASQVAQWWQTHLPMQETQRHGFNPWVRKMPWRRNGNLLSYSCLRTPLHREAWRATVHGITKRWTRLRQAEHEHHAPEELFLPCFEMMFLLIYFLMDFIMWPSGVMDCMYVGTSYRTSYMISSELLSYQFKNNEM